MSKIRQDVIGSLYATNNFGDIVVREYKNAHDVLVEFLDTGGVVRTSFDSVRRGLVKDPLARTVCGVGFVGSKYPTSVNRKHTKTYKLWHGMLERCYGGSIRTASYVRKGVEVHEDFHSYEYFHEFCQNLQNYDKDGWAMDKDLLGDGLIYSPATVCMIPSSINSALITGGRDDEAYRLIKKRNVAELARRYMNELPLAVYEALIEWEPK